MNNKLIIIKDRVNNNKYIRMGLAALLVASISFFTGDKIVKAIEASKYKTVVAINEKISLSSKASVVESIKSLAKLNISNVEVSKDSSFKIDKWYGDKEKIATFYANCIFSLDFSKLNEGNVYIDENNIIINTKPLTMSVEFNEDKTEFKKTKNTGISSGELKLTVEEVERSKSALKQVIYNEVYNSSLEDAQKRASEELNKLIKNIVKKDVDIKINYIE